MPRTRVKICGITDVSNGLTALEHGADALGFVLVDSPRQVTMEDAGEVLKHLPRPFEPVGVLRDINYAELFDDYAGSCFETLQIDANWVFGDRYCGLFLWHVVRIGSSGESDLQDCPSERCWSQPLVVEGPRSGVGETCDWTEAARIAKHRRIILAGGLTPDNVAEAIRTVRPYGVDVSSGVESSPGKKDPIKIRDFLQAVRDVDRELQ